MSSFTYFSRPQPKVRSLSPAERRRFWRHVRVDWGRRTAAMLARAGEMVPAVLAGGAITEAAFEREAAAWRVPRLIAYTELKSVGGRRVRPGGVRSVYLSPDRVRAGIDPA